MKRDREGRFHREAIVVVALALAVAALLLVLSLLAPSVLGGPG